MKYLSINYRRLPFYSYLLILMVSFFSIDAGNQLVVYERPIKNKTKTVHWQCSTSGNFVVTTCADNPKKRTVGPGTLKISAKNNQLLINNKPAQVGIIRISTDGSGIEVGEKTYHGSLRVELTDHLFCVTQEANLDFVIEQELVLAKDSSVDGKKEKDHFVRVLLSEQAENGGADWLLTCSDGFFIGEAHNLKNRTVVEGSQLNINSVVGSITINGKKQAHSHICIAPKSGHVRFNDQEYDGTFSIVFHKGQRLLINTISLEEYVCSVLRSESWPGWPLEVNKAFAIASRSYVLAMVLRAQKSKLPYHIKNTSVHQNYKGVHTNELLKHAVEHTKGVFLAHDKKPIIAMFDGCCGGVIPAKIGDFDFSKAPYLARNYPCTYCKSSSSYQWQAEYTLSDLSKCFGLPFSSSNTIKQVKIVKKDDAGLISLLSLKGVKDSLQIAGQKLYSMLKDVKSYCFSIIKKDHSVIFKGRGRGHHLGICQWGAREMVRVGKGYKDVLTFYYPGAEFACLS